MRFLGLDTALQNSGVVLLDHDGSILFAAKPFAKEETPMEGMERVLQVRDFVFSALRYVPTEDREFRRFHTFVAIEDWLMTGFSKAYQTAELIGIVKAYCHDNNLGYCMVHPGKTKKYVIKQKEVTKTEIIAYWRARCEHENQKYNPFNDPKIPKNQWSDIADALSIAHIGRLVWQQHTKNLSAIPTDPLEERWEEIIFGDTGTGILTKPGLAWFPEG